MNWNGKNVFVTGGAGFVGSHLVRRLIQEKANIAVLVQDASPLSFPQNVSIIRGDLEDFSLLQRSICRYEIDSVFHLGAQTLVQTALHHPWDTFESNIRGTYNLLEACRVYSSSVKRIVLASSDKAYGPKSDLPYKEEMASEATHPYDVSKACADLIALSYHKMYDLPLVIGRCANIYGGGDLHWSRLIPGTIRFLQQNRPIELRSDGSYIREYLYVEDAVDAYLCMASRVDDAKVAGQIFNFGPQKPYAAIEIIQIIQHLMHRKEAPITFLKNAKHEIREQFLDSSKAKHLLHWQPKTSLEDGLRKSIDWYLSYLEAYR